MPADRVENDWTTHATAPAHLGIRTCAHTHLLPYLSHRPGRPKQTPGVRHMSFYSFKPTRPALDALEVLKPLLPKGAEVYVIQRHVSGSGMTRYLSLYVIEDGAPRQVTGLVAALTGERIYEAKGHFSLKVTGAGMDMHWHTVYGLSRRIHGDGYALTAVTL